MIRWLKGEEGVDKVPVHIGRKGKVHRAPDSKGPGIESPGKVDPEIGFEGLGIEGSAGKSLTEKVTSEGFSAF